MNQIIVHQRAIGYLTLMRDCENRIKDFEKRIEIEEGKEVINQYLTVSKNWLINQKNRFNILRFYCKTRYQKTVYEICRQN